ncbi:MAG: hypothetical protein [Myoviridae sp. ctThM1]|nr:MAG: hypothetical protein [Myoviridae sp. ctThM1]
MSYDKPKALGIIQGLKEQNNSDENYIVACDDLSYSLSLALIAYSSHLSIWADIPEHADEDTKQYWAALHNIHNVLTEAGVFEYD